MVKMSYTKAMKHWKNHNKDKFHQQCSGYSFGRADKFGVRCCGTCTKTECENRRIDLTKNWWCEEHKGTDENIKYI